MNRPALAIGAALVVGGGIVAWLVLRGGSAAPKEPVAPARPAAGSAIRADRLPPPVPDLGSAVAEANGEDVTVLPDGTREYMQNGVLIRDHRTGDHPKDDLPPNVHLPQGPRIAPALTSAVAAQYKTVIAQCAAQVPPEARGAQPRLDSTIAINVKGGQATIVSAAAQLRDVVGAALDPAKQCIEKNAVGLSVPAPADTPEVENYSISMSLRLP